LQQEQLDEQMLRSGTVPQDRVQRLPEVGSGPSKLRYDIYVDAIGWRADSSICSQEQAYSGRGGRGRRAAEVTGGDGDVGRITTGVGKEFILAGISEGTDSFCVHIVLLAPLLRLYYNHRYRADASLWLGLHIFCNNNSAFLHINSHAFIAGDWSRHLHT